MLIFRWHAWHGESGRPYRFKITLTDKGLPDAGGIYVFVRRRFVFWLEPLYIGKAANFKSRLIGHERWREAWWNRGATERHILCIESETRRVRIEEDLIRGEKPVMNNIHIPRSRKDAPNNKRLKRRWKPRHKPFFGLFG